MVDSRIHTGIQTHFGVLQLLCAVLFLYAQTAAFADDKLMEKGKAIYAKQCADCHGDRGQGVQSVYAEPLIGDLAVSELADYISAAMPEGEPEACVAEDAEAVAAYIHEEFYSIIARVRNQPPTVDFSRLTVRQYRNSVADLVASFQWGNQFGDEQGLQGRYYKSRNRGKDNIAIERIDHGIDFDFGEAGPDPETIKDEQYVINWSGSVFAPETGYYEFIVDSSNGGELWINGGSEPLIDFRVKSGDQTEYRKDIFLIEGRAYSLRLDLNKAKSDKTVGIKLKWKPPHGPEQLIPPHALSKATFPEWLIVETNFPPDDKSVGYERGVQVSPEWDEATTAAAIEVADKVMARLDSLIKVREFNAETEPKLKQFCVDFASRAFRRPLSDEVKKLYVDQHFEDAPDLAVAVKRSVLLTLKSPRFLFPYIGSSEFDDYDYAAWMALTLWDSIPDASLLKSAAQKKLVDGKDLQSQAERMAKDMRARSKVRAFFHQWLYFDHFSEMDKSDEEHAQFTPELAHDLKSSLELYLNDIFWSEESDFRTLLQADSIFVNPRIAEFYGLPEVKGPLFEKVSFEPDKRSGILTHPYMLAGLAYEDATSPIHRGVFLSRSLLGRFLKPPPIAVSPTPPDLDPSLTTRERTAHQTAPVACKSCHGLINHLGFALENFDEVGRYRTKEGEKTIDSSGSYVSREGDETKFAGAEELSKFLVTSDEAHQAFIEQMFQYLTKQPIQAFGPEMLSQLHDDFQKNNFNMQRMLVQIALKSAHQRRQARQDQLAKTAAN